MQKTLLVCLDNLGDLVFTSTIALSLSQNPEVELSLWSKSYTSAIGCLMPGVKHVFAADPFWDRAPGRSRGSLLHFMKIWREIRRQKFTLALMPTSNWWVAMFVWLAGIPVRVGFAGRKNQRWLTHSLPKPGAQEAVVTALQRTFAAYLLR